ncbi:MAG: trimethylamine-N-oxide reductase (cytochrome c), cytochrome c-type subunit TorC [Thermotogaceae bacterium]|jgi:nitrate/TMAO reductase-like tetraheme cytochrome c subunit|nr:trimethylamine-N-oxide reductase (cytochrome c), cytochrome c-type subunit TorC [Thermotogaceae bacterium]
MKKMLDFLKLLYELVIFAFYLLRILIGVVAKYGKLSEKTAFFGVGVIVVAGVLAVVSLEATSTNSFCLSCHPYFEEEYYQSVHGQNDVSCADCHIPHDDIVDYAKVKLMGLKEAWIYFTEPHPESREDWYKNYKTKWEELAYEHNLKEETCLECHGEDGEYYYMNVKLDDIYIHKNLKVEEKGLSCFDCHYNFVHGILEWKGEVNE